jgi:hypothetical protein
MGRRNFGVPASSPQQPPGFRQSLGETAGISRESAKITNIIKSCQISGIRIASAITPASYALREICNASSGCFAERMIAHNIFRTLIIGSSSIMKNVGLGMENITCGDSFPILYDVYGSDAITEIIAVLLLQSL